MMKSSKSLFSIFFGVFSSFANGMPGATGPFVGKNISSVCSDIIKTDATFYTVNSDGVITGNSIDAGSIYEKNIKLSADDVLIDTNHTLVINRTGHVKFDVPDMKFNRVKSICPRTSEFGATYNPSTRSANVGKYSAKIPVWASVADEAQIEGNIQLSVDIFSPKIALESSSNTLSDAADFFSSKASKLILKFKNVGSYPLAISGLVRKTAGSDWYSIDTNSCNNPSVAPQESCNIIFRRLSAPAKKVGYRDELDITSNYKLGYPALLINWSATKPEIEFAWH